MAIVCARTASENASLYVEPVDDVFEITGNRDTEWHIANILEYL